MVPKVEVLVSNLQNRIESSWAGPDIDREAVEETIAKLDNGTLRVAEKVNGEWIVHGWMKQAILLYFRISEMKLGSYGDYIYHDKIPLKTDLVEQGVRVIDAGCMAPRKPSAAHREAYS